MKCFDILEIGKKIEIMDIGAAAITETPVYKRLIDLGLGNLNAFEGDKRQSQKLKDEYGTNIKLFEKNLNQNGFLTSLKNDFSNLFILKKINLTGRHQTKIDLIKNIVNIETNQDINLITYETKKLKFLLKELPWIKEVSIKKHLPDTISINIEEHKAFAVFNKNNKNFLVSDKGNIIYEVKN